METGARHMVLLHRPILIGQAPGPNTDPDYPLFPLPPRSAGGRLQALTGLTVSGYLRTFDRTNLLYEFPGARGTKHSRTVDHVVDAFPVRQARIAAMALRPLLAGRRVILLGRGVATAFRLDPRLEPFQWVTLHCGTGPAWPRSNCQVAMVPHTSGRSRFYNDPGNVARVRAFFEQLLAEPTCLPPEAGA